MVNDRIALFPSGKCSDVAPFDIGVTVRVHRSVGIRFGRKQFTVYRGDLIRELAHFSQREGPNIRSVVIGSVSDMIITGGF